MFFSYITKNKKKIEWTLALILTFILIVIIYLQFFKQDAITEGAERAVYCTACKSIGEKVILDIDDDKDQRNYCKLCGGRLRYACKCEACQYEFPLSPLVAPKDEEIKNTMDKFRYLRDREKCPNCGVIPPQTRIMSTDDVVRRTEL
ncbi:MAG TPA: hypothetical protein PK821_03170 [Victivallales bacterium]|nr:hypothetical protein [Victivallales bacterium]